MKHASLPDEELARLFAETGQSVYFALIYQRYHRLVLSRYRRFTTNTHEAQDLTQDLFIRLFRRLNTYAGRSCFRTWLLAVVRNSGIDYVRQRQMHPVFYCDAATLPVTPCQDYSEENTPLKLARFDAALDRLPVTDARLIWQHYCERVPVLLLAEQLRLSESAVKMRLLRARARLRNEYDQGRSADLPTP